MPIPNRSFGAAVNNDNLHPSLSIIGLGCSSFSSFFLEGTEDDLQFTQDTVHKLACDHPKVLEWIELIHHAVKNGINVLDTAPWYGHGTSEVVIGYAMDQKKLDRRKIVINTKVGRYDAKESKQFDFSYNATIESCKRSLERMRCDYIDVLQLHDPEFCPDISILMEHTIPAMIECKRRGWVKALGLTGYPLEIHFDILETLRKSGKDKVFDQSLTYCQFNLHNMNLFAKSMTYNTQKMSLLEYFKKRNIGVMVAAPLSMGLLSHRKPPVWHPASEKLKCACKEAAAIAESHGVDLADLALLFSMAHDSISCTLLGMGTKEELDRALALVKRYEAIFQEESSVDSIGLNGISDKGVEISRTLRLKLGPILSDSEKVVLEMVLNPDIGPFAELWKCDEYDWDGFKEADAFWSRHGDKQAAMNSMKLR